MRWSGFACTAINQQGLDKIFLFYFYKRYLVRFSIVFHVKQMFVFAGAVSRETGHFDLILLRSEQ